jgi:hypothetical protein
MKLCTAVSLLLASSFALAEGAPSVTLFPRSLASD